MMKPCILSCLCACLIVAQAVADLVTSQGTGNWESGSTWSSNPDIPATDDEVTVQAGHTVTIIAAGQIEISSLNVSGTLTHSANGTSDQVKRVDVKTLGDITITSGGKIDVKAKGYSPGTSTGGYGPRGGGYGSGRYLSAGGAGQGGQGGSGTSGGGGNVIGDLFFPTTIGSGGGGCENQVGGAGGGGVKLETPGTLTVSGSIIADGANGYYAYRGPGGGAGGSIWLIATNLAGAGLVQADGGDVPGNSGYSDNGGGGGGGRIALYYTSNTFSGTVAARGGASGDSSGKTGGAGTILGNHGVKP